MTGARRAPRPSRVPHERDTDATPFGDILRRLVDRLPGAYAAALVDIEGETVDYVGLSGSFELRIAAAEARLALDQIHRGLAGRSQTGEVRWLVALGAQRSFLVRQLSEGYAVVVLFRRRAGLTASRRAFAVCARELAVEAGWPPPASVRAARAGQSTTTEGLHARRAPRALCGIGDVDTEWWPVDVQEALVDGRTRPRRVRPSGAADTEWQRIEVLGAVVGLPPRERGFRVRTHHGEELTLVREPGRVWYADVALRMPKR